MAITPIRIELSRPPRVNGVAASSQSLWFALRLWLAVAQADSGRPRWLRTEALRDRYAATRNPRMVVSRAFADFARWELSVGWGRNLERPIAMLPLRGRSQGPFWLPQGESERFLITLDGAPASVAQVSDWLDCGPTGELSEIAEGSAASASYWNTWARAKRDVLDGRLIMDGKDGALAGYRRAQAMADDSYHEAMALLQQAIVWRRAGNADAALAVLTRIDRQWHDAQAPEHAWLGAMAAILSAWCVYASRDHLAALRTLHAASADPRWTPLFQHHPRIRGEYANLQALIHRAMALDERLTELERERAACTAVHSFQRALAMANEADLFDAAASAASNLGWSLWLFGRCGLRLPEECSTVPLHWIALAGALVELHQIGGGSWNSIYLLRMVREGGPVEPHPEAPQFRRWPVLAPEQFLAAVYPITPPLPRTWLELATTEMAAVANGSIQVDVLQRANLLLELAWYEAYEGDLGRAATAADQLRRRLCEIAPSDRSYFREALIRLPF